MKINLDILPATAKRLLICYDGWLLGSTAEKILAGKQPTSDIDIMIPYGNWSQAVLLIPKNAVLNTFGGLKFEIEGYVFDVWPDSIERLMSYSQFKIAYQAKYDIILQRRLCSV